VTVDLLPEVALGAANAMRAALDHSSPREASAQTVAALLRQSSLFLDFIRTYRDALVAELDEKGKDPDALRSACQISLDTLDRTAETQRMLWKLLVENEHVKELLRQEEVAELVRQTFVDWQEALNRPFPPLDLKELEEEARADVEAGRMIRVEKFEDLFPSHSDGD
jgi:hypothetical protein